MRDASSPEDVEAAAPERPTPSPSIARDAPGPDDAPSMLADAIERSTGKNRHEATDWGALVGNAIW
jgi:hypothetical protein